MNCLTQIKITARDREVLEFLVQGCSNKEIAAQLLISPRTVKQHLRTLFLRAGIREGRKRVKLATAMFDLTQGENRGRLLGLDPDRKLTVPSRGTPSEDASFESSGLGSGKIGEIEIKIVEIDLGQEGHAHATV